MRCFKCLAAVCGPSKSEGRMLLYQWDIVTLKKRKVFYWQVGSWRICLHIMVKGTTTKGNKQKPQYGCDGKNPYISINWYISWRIQDNAGWISMFAVRPQPCPWMHQKPPTAAPEHQLNLENYPPPQLQSYSIFRRKTFLKRSSLFNTVLEVGIILNVYVADVYKCSIFSKNKIMCKILYIPNVYLMASQVLRMGFETVIVCISLLMMLQIL